MRHRLIRLSTFVAIFAGATPACASDGVVLPEPGSVTLVSLAMAGVLIGRRMSSKRPSDD